MIAARRALFAPHRLILSCLLAASLSSCSGVNGWVQAFLPDQQQRVLKSPGDSRSFRYLELDSSLKVLLVSDTESETAAASLDVNVGSRHDPKDRQGLAHFLEHMLFLGTEQFPEADSYQQFISANGGTHNAYTSFEHTNYFFDINNEALPEALDRFADFFIAPLFSPEYVEREVNAVESEYRARIKDEDRRVLDATQQVLNPDHPFRKFTVGSLSTLTSTASRDVRDDMMAFYQRYYSASRMSLVLVGDYSLDELQVMVEQRFAKINNNATEVAPITQPLFLSTDTVAADTGSADINNIDNVGHALPLFLAVQAEKPLRQLRFMFPVPDAAKHYRSKPLGFIGNILGHEGQGSLLSQLKRAGWAEGLSAGIGFQYNGGTSFQLVVSLTEQGLDAIPEVYRTVFNAIGYLSEAHQQQPDKTAALYREQSQLAELAFRFFQSGRARSAAVRAAANLHIYDAGDVIYGDYAFTDYDPTLIDKYLARLNENNVLVTLLARQLPQRYATDQVSPWFDAPYTVMPLAGAFDAPSSTPVDRYFHLPESNPFIADNFTLFAADKSSATQPTVFITDPGKRLWLKTDDDFEIPKADALFGFLSTYPKRSARHNALSQLYSRVVSEQLNEFVYPAYLAGMSYAFYAHQRGFTLRLGGYNDSLEVLADKIIPALQRIDIDDERFQQIKAELARGWALEIESTPYDRLSYTLSKALYEQSYDETELIDALDSIELDDLRDFVKALWPTVYVDGLLHGNVDQAMAERLFTMIETLPDCECQAASRQHIAVNRLPAGRWQQAQTLKHSDAALVWYFQAGDDSLRTAAKTMLAAAILQPRVFNELRTRQQLGYVVGAQYFSAVKWPGLMFQVQSPSTDEAGIFRALQQFIDDFLEGAGSQVMTEADFLQHRQALIDRLREKDNNQSARSNRYWTSIALADSDFLRQRALADALESVSYQQWRQFIRQLLQDSEASLLQYTLPEGRSTHRFAHGQDWPTNKTDSVRYY